MFGGHDDGMPGAQSPAVTPQNDTLNGVADLAAGAAVPTASDAAYPAPAPAPAQPSFSMTASPLPPQPAAEPTPVIDEPAAAEPEEPSVPSAPAMPVAGDDELMELKQQALRQLSPLVGHLDQSPEEKFRTTMMLIQASDNQDLLKEAYAAAQDISDEKERAQALLDVINEINYFTQKSQG